MSEKKCGGNKMCQLLSAKELAGILSTSVRTVWRLRSAGKLPRPVTIGHSIRWVESTIAKWLEAGAPDRKTFEAMMEVER
ncbi:helix-turn-helix transcriptional regulator [Planctomycetota bacterium]